MRALLKKYHTEKRRAFRVLAVILAAAAVTGLGGCNTSGCTELHSSIPLAAFYRAGSETAISVDSVQIHGVGAPGDSVLLAAGTVAAQVYLPMRSSQQTTSWCFTYKSRELLARGVTDTLTFDYTSEPYLASDECGAMYRYRINGVHYTENVIDSVSVPEPLITNNDAVSVRIFFRVADADSERRTR